MKQKILLIIPCLAFIFSCQEMEHEPLLKSDKIPSKLSITAIENKNGGAKITYALPDDSDILYVLATFSTLNGEERVVKSSIYKNYVVLDGFADTHEYTVNLYTVNRFENRSEPVVGKINPLTPPIEDVFKSLKIIPDFGGVNAQFVNEPEAEYVFYTLYKNKDGEWVNYDRLYTKSKSRNYSVRGLPAEPTEFAFYFTDRWKNYSDTLTTKITPLYEEKLDKKLWKHLALDNDTYATAYPARTIITLWDGGYSATEYFLGAVTTKPLPMWFTVDLGKKAKFSRLVVDQFCVNNYAYLLGNPKIFEIWGSNNPTIDGSWNNWTLLLQGESVKPSGSPVGVKTAEDNAYALAGESFSFPSQPVSYRYIRFKMVEAWTLYNSLLLAELTLYGQPD
jgi:hypothetical protein